MKRVLTCRSIVAWVGLAGAVALASAAGAANGADAAKSPSSSAPASAEAMVADALRAEIDGNLAKRRVLLSVAMDTQPDFAPARWHSGQIRAGDDWVSVKESQAAAAANPARAEYESMRAAAKDSPDAQLALARWCRKNGLEDEARFHWATLLTSQPNNNEALRALGVRWFNGRLMTKSEIAAAKAAWKAAREAIKAYEQQVARWERLLAAGDVKSRKEALQEIRELKDVRAAAALEEITLARELKDNEEFEKCLQMSEAWLDALRSMPEQEATLSLVRHAVFSPLASVRREATAALKERSPHDYVPTLLGALAMPLESTFRVVTDTDGSVHYFHSLYREGPVSDWSFEGRLSAMQHDLQGPTLLHINDPARKQQWSELQTAANDPLVRAEMASVARSNQERFGTQALSAQQQVAAANRATAAMNALIIPVLTATTGEDFGDNPRKWWDWWLRYNEYSTDAERPVQEQRVADSTHRYYRAPSEQSVTVLPVPDEVKKVSTPQRRFTYGQQGRREVRLPSVPFIQAGECFAAGTPVWTRTGLKPIESLGMGDFVLAQSVDTGELTYKPVLGRTVRPPSPCHKLSLGTEEIVTAAGHPFWVAGVGWQMAKELQEGAVLHGVNGPVDLDRVGETDEVETFNLVVADFNTYFVGESGVLVHDITPRRPTAAVVPGLVPAEEGR